MADLNGASGRRKLIVNLTLTPQSHRLAPLRHGRCTVPPAQVFSGMRMRKSGTVMSRQGSRGGEFKV